MVHTLTVQIKVYTTYTGLTQRDSKSLPHNRPWGFTKGWGDGYYHNIRELWGLGVCLTIPHEGEKKSQLGGLQEIHSEEPASFSLLIYEDTTGWRQQSGKDRDELGVNISSKEDECTLQLKSTIGKGLYPKVLSVRKDINKNRFR